ncbi:hypothetical protein OESDEN_02439 [Oesophagostomum dentatum]|uniref:Uncharacterized protein n=1 Tax=Oesophagostomum dentatum TaxID=61180 RepID=A0A0B1TQB4_OESDE|nr:hypothetical protein OESDEN_02439 [Oesophagostomum dentatum]
MEGSDAFMFVDEKSCLKDCRDIVTQCCFYPIDKRQGEQEKTPSSVMNVFLLLLLISAGVVAYPWPGYGRPILGGGNYGYGAGGGGFPGGGIQGGGFPGGGFQGGGFPGGGGAFPGGGGGGFGQQSGFSESQSSSFQQSQGGSTFGGGFGRR